MRLPPREGPTPHGQVQMKTRRSTRGFRFPKCSDPPTGPLASSHAKFFSDFTSQSVKLQDTPCFFGKTWKEPERFL